MQLKPCGYRNILSLCFYSFLKCPPTEPGLRPRFSLHEYFSSKKNCDKQLVRTWTPPPVTPVALAAPASSVWSACSPEFKLLNKRLACRLLSLLLCRLQETRLRDSSVEAAVRRCAGRAARSWLRFQWKHNQHGTAFATRRESHIT